MTIDEFVTELLDSSKPQWSPEAIVFMQNSSPIPVKDMADAIQVNLEKLKQRI